jgi:TPR repeat protein
VCVLLLVPASILTVYGVQRLWICEPLAWSGLGHAQVCTGRLYENGDGGAIRNENTARLWYRKAAAQGVAEAEYQVGLFTYDREEKIQWLARAADHGHAAAAYKLYWLLEKIEPEAAVLRLQEAARQKHPGAQFRLGVLHRSGYGVEKDLQRTRKLWRQSAKGGYISAMRALAVAYASDSILFDYDPELSRRWEQRAHALAQSRPEIPTIEQALEWNWERELLEVRQRRARAEAGDADAQLEIGRRILQQAPEDPKSIERAYRWIEQAAESGSVDAQYQLATYYLEADPEQEAAREKGRQWLIRAADGGHEDALRQVITAFKDQEYGFPRDLERSRAYSQAQFEGFTSRGILRNHPDRMSAGWEYSDTLAQIEKEANQYLPPDELRRQSDAGDPIAQYHLGKEVMATRYYEGFALIKASAEAGYPQAQYEVARSYRTRQRTLEEERQAVELLTSAARSGHRGAMVDLGLVYVQGVKNIDLKRNRYRAKGLFEQARRDREDVVYLQKGRNGRSWSYTVDIVDRHLSRLPENLQRLDLEGLEGELRSEAIEQWYTEEQQRLQTQIQDSQSEDRAVLQKQLEELSKQRDVLLDEDQP